MDISALGQEDIGTLFSPSLFDFSTLTCPFVPVLVSSPCFLYTGKSMEATAELTTYQLVQMILPPKYQSAPASNVRQSIPAQRARKARFAKHCTHTQIHTQPHTRKPAHWHTHTRVKPRLNWSCVNLTLHTSWWKAESIFFSSSSVWALF